MRYLLGQLSEDEQQRVERRYFRDDDYYEQLEAAEDELVDAYVGRRLSAAEREMFEQRFLTTPDRLEKVEFAREWKAFVSDWSRAAKAKEKAKRASWLGIFHNRAIVIPLAMLMILAVGVIWLALRLERTNDEINQLRAASDAKLEAEEKLHGELANEQRRNQQLLDELQDARARREAEELQNERGKPEIENRSPSLPPPPVIASFVLSSALTRDRGAADKFQVPLEATEVWLQAAFKAVDYPSYEAELQTVEGRRVWNQRGLSARSKGRERAVIVKLPARALDDQDYILTLKGITSSGESVIVNEYSFRIVK